MKAAAWFMVATALSLVPLTAGADPPGREGRKEAREAAKDAREAHKDTKEAREDAKDARKALQAARDAGADARAARRDLNQARKELEASRDDRRKAAKTALKAKWGDELLEKPAVRAELRLHAQRMAKLNHMKRVAESSDKDELAERVEKLKAKEEARHDARMADLKAKKGEEK